MSNYKKKIAIIVFILLWSVLHIPGLIYGTKDIPLHQSYVGDEQAPVNGALHIIEKKNILGLRNKNTVYYGPIFSIIAVPGILADFSLKYIMGEVKTADDYKNNILWNWGGIIIFSRIIALLFSILGLYYVYKICNTKTINPNQKQLIALLPVLLIAINFYYFEYSHFFKHWAFILTLLFIQIYSLIRIVEVRESNKKYWIIHLVATLISFGISYVSIIFSAIWLPVLYKKWKESDWCFFKNALYNLLYLSMGIAVIYWWHPYAFNRLLGFVGVGEATGGLNNTQNPFAFTSNSFSYYLNEIVLNNLPLVLAFILLFVIAIKYGALLKKYWFYVLSIPIILNFLLFAPAEHHEGRYMLPTISMLILLAGVLLINLNDYLSTLKLKRIFSIIVFTLISLQLILHIVYIAKWIQIYNEGPIGEQIVNKIVAEQKIGEKILIVDSYILGYPHTIDAYKNYMETTNKTESNLYKQIINTPTPKGVTPINAYYIYNSGLDKIFKITDSYKHIIGLYQPRIELNQFDYFDENVFRLWNFYDFAPHYYYLK